MLISFYLGLFNIFKTLADPIKILENYTCNHPIVKVWVLLVIFI